MSVPRGARRLRRLFDRIPPRLITVAELLVSLTITVLVAAWLDRAYTKYVSGPRVSAPSTDNCWGPDPRMHHTLRPNCSGLIHWGKESYAVHTNNLGLRDAQVSDVPMAEERTRVLLLGDSMVEGVQAWPDIIAGIIQAQLPQYRFLDGGRTSYSPSNYLLLTRSLLERGVKFDEVMVFIDISDIQDEAAYYRDNEQTGGLEGPSVYADQSTWYARQRVAISARYYLTDVWFTDLEYLAIRSGFYFKPFLQMGNVFDLPRGAWTYRSISDALPYSSGYGPLGLGAGLEKAKAKMTALREELARRGIPLSVVVYPWPQQLAHDSVDSRQVMLWREWCVNACKRFISLFPAFFAIKDACPWYAPGCWYDYYVFGDVHFNPRGNKVIADAVVRALSEDPPKKLAP